VSFLTIVKLFFKYFPLLLELGRKIDDKVENYTDELDRKKVKEISKKLRSKDVKERNAAINDLFS
jgi:hypothetical protein